MLLSTLLSVSLFAPPVTAPQAPPTDPLHMIRVELSSARAASDLARLGLDIVRFDRRQADDPGAPWATAQVVADDADLALLRARDWNAEVLIEDLTRHYADRLVNGPRSTAPTKYGSWLNPPFASGGMGGFYTFSEVVSVLDQIQAAYPSIVAPRVSLGQAHDGNDLWMVKVSDNPTIDEGEAEARIDAMHHAREPGAMQATLWFLLWLCEEYGNDPFATYLVDEREIFLVPVVNPDGYLYNEQISPGGGGMWRKNRRNNGGGVYGVDLNRNYPYQWGYDNVGSSGNPGDSTYRGPSAASEPETQALRTLSNARQFGTVLSIHTHGNILLSPLSYIQSAPANWDEYEEVGDLITEFNGFPHGYNLLYFSNGTTRDTEHHFHGTLAWTPELGTDNDGFWPPQSRIEPISEENRLMLARAVMAAGSWVRAAGITAVDAGDGDGSFEGGEVVEVTVALRNSGRQASLPVDLTMTTTSGWAQIQNGNASAGAINPYSDGSNGTPLTLRITPGAPAGEAIDLQITVSDGSWVDQLETDILVGDQVIVASFDFEAGGNEGWSVGAPNDASTGEWERVDPVGTEAQPEDDHTPSPGTHCWVTGQGIVGGGLGDDDVDGGYTSLWSPTFDLSGSEIARVRYWRWYSNDKGSNPNSDIFEVEVSDDNGANWVNAETVGPAGPESNGGWYEAVLELETIPNLELTDQMRMRFKASDLGSGSIVEAAVDDFEVTYLGDGDCPAPDSYCTTSPNSVGPGALMNWSGSTGVGDNDFTLKATGAPPGQFAMFLFGVNETSNPLGDGILCIGPPQQRLGVITIDGAGVATKYVDLTAPPAVGQLVPGSTWNFQLWYRDPGFGSFGNNLSDGLKVEFCD